MKLSFLKCYLVSSLCCLGCGTAVQAEKFSRANDFEANVLGQVQGNSHGGVLAPDSNRWSYFLIPELLHAGGDGWMDPSAWKPLDGLVAQQIKEGFGLHEFRVSRAGAVLYWNRNTDNPETDLARAWLAVVFTAPESGVYSLEGDLLWRNPLPTATTSAAVRIGRIDGEPPRFEELFNSKLTGEGKMETPEEVSGFAVGEAIRDISLEAGGQLAFVWQSDRANYRRLEIADDGMRIVRAGADGVKIDENVQRETIDLQRLLSVLYLSGEQTAGAREKRDAGDYRGAVRAYLGLLADRSPGLPGVEPFVYWLYGPADADRLLQGELGFVRYGDTQSSLVARIGPPGEIQYFQPVGDYTASIRDISSMHWPTKHADAYKKTGDPKYLDAWLATWDDFYENWDAQYAALRKDPTSLGLDPEVVAGVKGTDWLNAQLYLAWRLEAFYQGLATVLTTAKARGELDRIDEVRMARLLTGMIAGDATRSRNWLGRADKLVPNQIRHLGKSLFQLGVFMPEVRDADWWRTESLPLYTLTYLPDGSDREQSLNYFNNSLPSLVQALELLPVDARDESLIAGLSDQSETRDRFLPSIVRPDGILPSIGKNNHWRQFGETKPLDPPSRVFTSVFFPYGGYAVQRDGWEPESLYLFMKTSRPAIGHWRSQEGGLQVSAHGRNLLVSGIGELYSAQDGEGGWAPYWYSAVAQNTILVDGQSPVTRKWEGVGPDSLIWHTSNDFDVAETVITQGYGGGDIFGPREALGSGPPVEAGITDTTHHRRVIFLRDIGAWIVIDTVDSGSARRIMQTWNFGPEFSAEEVVTDASKKLVETRQPDAPNLLIRQFGSPEITYRKFFGQNDEDGVFGWVGILADRESWTYTPVVDVHANWENQGSQTVVSFLLPSAPGESPDFDIKDASSNGLIGFDLTATDGRRVAFRHAASPTKMQVDGVTADAQELLVITKPDGTTSGLAFESGMFNGSATPGPNFEFTGQSQGRPWWTFWKSRKDAFTMSLLKTPNSFAWKEAPEGLVPLLFENMD